MIAGTVAVGQLGYIDVSEFARKNYAERLGANISAVPEVYAYARTGSEIIGCLGLYRADKHQPLLIERYIDKPFEKISRTASVERKDCGEIGTRSVHGVSKFNATEISLALSAHILISAHAEGIKYLGFTSNRTTRDLARILKVELVALGEPDLLNMSQDFRKNWMRFFQVKQFCFGFRLQSISGALEVLEQLKGRGVQSL